MKMIFILVLILTLLLVGCTSDVVSENDDEMSMEVIRAVNELFSEENWSRMELLFEEIEYELVNFVYYLKENEMIEWFKGRRVDFPAIYNGEIVMHRNSGPVSLLMRDDSVFFNSMKGISEQGIIASVSVESDLDLWIRFRINSEKNPLTTHINDGLNFFHYMEGEDVAPDRFMRIGGGWYAEIVPPHGFH